MQLSFIVLISALVIKAVTGFKGLFISKDVEVLSDVDFTETEQSVDDMISEDEAWGVSSKKEQTKNDTVKTTETSSKTGYSKLAHNIDGVEDAPGDFISLEDLTKDIVNKK